MVDNSASLLTRQAMGGIRGGKGYKFQDAYIVIKIPDWICQSNFCQILKEGSGDVDILFRDDSHEYRVYTQVKDHTVSATKFREVLKEFEQKDRATPNTYKTFILASTGLVGEVEKFRVALDRYRGIGDFFNEQSDQVEKATLSDLQVVAEDLGVLKSLDFIIERVEFETGLPGLTQIKQVLKIFCGGMLDVPQYQDHIGRVFQPVFQSLYLHIVDAPGRAITRHELETKITEAIENYRLQIQEHGFTVRMYHWEDESFDRNLAYDALIDWSEHFNRTTRNAPGSNTWIDLLLPELLQLQKRVRKTGPARLVKFKGSSSLSAGIAFGWAFPEVAQYAIEFQQRVGSRTETWRTDVAPTRNYELQHSESAISESAGDLLVKFNMSADVSSEVEKSFTALGTIFRASLTLCPQGGIGEYLTNESAVAYARDAKRLIRQAVNKYKTEKIHVFFAGPLGLAIFFGQLLNAMPDTQCYEQNANGGYSPSCLLVKR